MSIEFLLTTLIIVASPGTGAVYTLAAGLSRGGKASVLAAFACTLGVVPHLIAALTGLAALLHTSALAFEIVKYAGVAYLLYMAWQSLRDNGALKIDDRPDARSARQVLVDGVLINLLNPKLTIFFVAFLPQFATGLSQMVTLSAVFMALTFVVFAVYGVFAASMRDRVLARPRVMVWLRRFFAASFAALGVPYPRLAVYLGILGELFGGIGLGLGALTPLAALGPVLSMGCAIYFAHRSNGLFATQGGFEFPGPWGLSVAPNITSSEDGLAGYSDAELVTMITEGRRPDGSAMLPPMPYGHFAKMTPEDMARMKLQPSSFWRELAGMHMAQNSVTEAIGTLPFSASDIGNSTALMRPG